MTVYKQVRLALRIFFVVLLALLLWQAVGYRQPVTAAHSVRALEGLRLETEGISKEIDLPNSLQAPSLQSPVVLYGQIDANVGESLFVKSVFAPMRLYLDGVLVYECGWPGSYPAYLNDPPVSLAIVNLPEQGGEVQVQVEYIFPTQRKKLSLPALYVGSETGLVQKLFLENAITFLFSLCLVFLGIVMAAMSCFLIRGFGSPFLWLGLFSLCAGLWVFGECDLSALLFPYPAILYLLDYLGLFCMTIPFLHFSLIIFKPVNRAPIHCLMVVHYISLAAACVLQFTGIMDLTISLYWFHIISPSAFLILAVNFLWEYIRHHNPYAKRFAPAIVLLAASTVLELLNYWLGTTQLTVLFQFGVLTFIGWLGVLSGDYLRRSVQTAAEKQRLEYEIAAMGQQLALQREQYGQITESMDSVRAMRHDLRHHLTVIGRFASLGDIDELQEYVQKLRQGPCSDREQLYCENHAVNALVCHYFDLAERDAVQIDAQLYLPENTGCIPAMDLCVLMGNLMENALEACRRMHDGKRFMRVQSQIQGDSLLIVVSNSFDGIWDKRDGAFLSRKRWEDGQRTGMGLPSVQAVAKKHRGLVEYTINNCIWTASVLVHME